MKKWAGRRWRRWNRQMLSVDERERQSSMSGIRRPWIVVLFLAVTTPLFSHITLDSPNGGEVFLTESTIPISWHITITHDLQNWDLWYSTVGSGGPWTPIAMDLAAGSSAVGSVHTYDWIVPVEAASATVWVRARMDNSATDYFDVSDGPFAVVAPGPDFVRGDSNGDQNVDIGDPIGVLTYLFASGFLPCLDAADGNNDGQLNIADSIYLLTWLFTPASPPPPAPFPNCGADPLPPDSVGCGASPCSP